MSEYILDDEGYVVIRFLDAAGNVMFVSSVDKAGKVTKTQSVKIKYLRKVYGPKTDFRKWLEDPNNMYVGRGGRIFIDKEIFHYPKSKWANPNPMEKGKVPTKKDYEENFKKYLKHLQKKGLTEESALDELRGKTLGCFCDTASTTGACSMDCHTKVLLELLQRKF